MWIVHCAQDRSLRVLLHENDSSEKTILSRLTTPIDVPRWPRIRCKSGMQTLTWILCFVASILVSLPSIYMGVSKMEYSQFYGGLNGENSLPKGESVRGRPFCDKPTFIFSWKMILFDASWFMFILFARISRSLSHPLVQWLAIEENVREYGAMMGYAWCHCYHIILYYILICSISLYYVLVYSILLIIKQYLFYVVFFKIYLS